MNTQTKKLHYIKRPVQDSILHQAQNIENWQIFLLHWESGAGKTVILEYLHEQIGKGYLFELERFSILKDPKAGFMEFLYGKKLFDYKPEIRVIIEQNIQASGFAKVEGNVQEIHIHHWQLSEWQIISEVLSAFWNYQEEYIYFDAIENIMKEEDWHIFLNILEILQKNWIKIIITSRNWDDEFDNIITEKIEKFTFSEAQDYITINFTKISSEYQGILLKLVRFFDKINQERYDPIMLTLFYSLYYFSIDNLISQLKEFTQSPDANLFIFGDEYVWRKNFHRKIERLILQKLFHKDERLLTFFKKTFLLRFYEKDVEYLQDSSTNSEWLAFEIFASINGRKIRNPHTKTLQWTLHDSLYHIIAKYFLSELSHHPTEYEEASKQYYLILEYWKGHRLEMNVCYEYIINVCNACHPSWSRSTSPVEFARFILNLGSEFYSFWFFQEAIIFYQQALNIRLGLQLSDPSNNSIKNDIALVYMYLGNVYECTWLYKKAIEQFQQVLNIRLSLQLSDSNNNSLKNDIARVYNNLGIAYNDTWKHEQAIEQFQQALNIRINLQLVDPNNNTFDNGIANIYNNLGWSLNCIWKYEQAIVQYQQALAIHRSLQLVTPYNTSNNNGIARVYLNLGIAYRRTWMYEQAITQYYLALQIRLSLQIEDPLNNSLKNDIANVYLNLGNALWDTWKYEQAIKQYHLALQIRLSLQIEDPLNNSLKNNIAKVYWWLGMAYYYWEEFNCGLYNFQKSLNIYLEIQKNDTENLSLQNDIANVYANLAEVLFVLWEYEDAQTHRTFSYESIVINDWMKSTVLELEFYHFAHHKDEYVKQSAKQKIESLLDEWINSHWWNFKANIKKAIQDGHPDRATLVELATRISVNIDYSEFLEASKNYWL